MKGTDCHDAVPTSPVLRSGRKNVIKKDGDNNKELVVEMDNKTIRKLAVGITERMSQLGFLPKQQQPSPVTGHHVEGKTTGRDLTPDGLRRSPRLKEKYLSPTNGGHRRPSPELVTSVSMSPSKQKVDLVSPRSMSKVLPPKTRGRSSSAWDENKYMNVQIIVTAIKPNMKQDEKKQKFTAQVFLNTNDVRLYKEMVHRFNQSEMNESSFGDQKRKRRVVITRGKKIGGVISSKRWDVLCDSFEERIRKMEQILYDYGYDTSETSVLSEDVTRSAQIRDGKSVIAFERLTRYRRDKTSSDCEADELDISLEDASFEEGAGHEDGQDSDGDDGHNQDDGQDGDEEEEEEAKDEEKGREADDGADDAEDELQTTDEEEDVDSIGLNTTMVDDGSMSQSKKKGEVSMRSKATQIDDGDRSRGKNLKAKENLLSAFSPSEDEESD